MAITAPVSLTKIKTEFSGPDNLAAYVRGGTYVPNISANNAVSTVATGLSIGQFLGATSLEVSLPSWNAGAGGAPSYSGTYDNNIGAIYLSTTGEGQTITGKIVLTVRTDGTMSAQQYYGEEGCGGTLSLWSPQNDHTWLQAGSASDVYVRLEQTTGDATLSGSAINTNLQLNSERSWNLCLGATFGDAIQQNWIGTISLRDSSNNVFVSKTINIFVNVVNSD